jgi:hypothetical protein
MWQLPSTIQEEHREELAMGMSALCGSCRALARSNIVRS